MQQTLSCLSSDCFLSTYGWAEIQGPTGKRGSSRDQVQDYKHQGTCMAAYNLEVCYFTSCLYLSYEIKTHQLYLSPKVLQVLRQKNGSTPLEGYLILFAFKCKHCYIWLFSVIQGGSWNVSKALISFVKK